MTLQEEFTQGTHWPGFWESYALALAQEFDGPTTYARLRDARTALATAMHDPKATATGEDAAWRLCKRIYRGIAKPDRPGLVFPRDHVYLSGYRLLSRYPAIPLSLYVGHVSIDDCKILEPLNIKPTRTPDRIAEQVVRDVVREMGVREER